MAEEETCCLCIPLHCGVFLIALLSCFEDFPVSVILAITFIVMLVHDTALTRLVFFVIYLVTQVVFSVLFLLAIFGVTTALLITLPEDTKVEGAMLIPVCIGFGLVTLIDIYFATVLWRYYKIADDEEKGAPKNMEIA